MFVLCNKSKKLQKRSWRPTFQSCRSQTIKNDRKDNEGERERERESVDRYIDREREDRQSANS